MLLGHVGCPVRLVGDEGGMGKRGRSHSNICFLSFNNEFSKKISEVEIKNKKY